MHRAREADLRPRGADLGAGARARRQAGRRRRRLRGIDELCLVESDRHRPFLGRRVRSARGRRARAAARPWRRNLSQAGAARGAARRLAALWRCRRRRLVFGAHPLRGAGRPHPPRPPVRAQLRGEPSRMSANGPFDDTQKRYLQGYVAGVEARRAAAGLPGAFGAPVPPAADDPQRAAQDRTVASGGKLVAEEQAKRAKNPLDRWDEFRAESAAGRFPKGTDVFLTKYLGLFYVAPAQNSFMCRLRFHGGIVSAHQLRGAADIAAELGGGYVDVTTRANLQIREIKAEHGPEVLTRLYDLGIVNRGAGADNIRNVTGSPTAGIDPDELIDTRPLCRDLHHYILNHRELYGLPRKFNIGFDGGGRIPVLEDTNDIGFVAVRVREGFGAAPGVYFRMELGGITGHGDFAKSTGVYLEPGECIKAAAAVLRVYIDHG